MDFKEQLRVYLEDGFNALPSVEILLTKNRHKIINLLDAVDEITFTPNDNNYNDITGTYVVDADDMATLVQARNELGGGGGE